MSALSPKQGKVKGENIKLIHKVNFFQKDELIQVMKKAGVVKSPTTALPDLQKAVLNIYSPKTLQMFCQFLSPGLFIEDDKKGNIVNIILSKFEFGNEEVYEHVII
jgi:hypothetical protein